MEMYQAFLLPLLASPNPTSPAQWSEVLEINYDAILPSTRRNVARSRSECTSAMRQVRADLAHWGEGCTGQQATGIGGSARSAAERNDRTAGEKADDRGGIEVVKLNNAAGGSVGREGGLAAQMKRKVRLVAVTPTQQISRSSVGREVSPISDRSSGSQLMGSAMVLLFTRDTSLLHAQDNSST